MRSNLWRALAAAVSLVSFMTAGWTAESEAELDLGTVSEGLKAIFHYGPGTK
jgi:hypothetical protein